MTPEGFEHTIPGSERPQTYALDRTATSISHIQDIALAERNNHSLILIAYSWLQLFVHSSEIFMQLKMKLYPILIVYC